VYKYYASIVLEVWDLESRCKSPIYSNYGETVDGLSVIRAYGFADAFLRKNMFLNDRVSNTGIAGRDLQIWYSFCLTTLGTIAFSVVGTTLLLNPLPQGKCEKYRVNQLIYLIRSNGLRALAHFGPVSRL
jgi:hypothetical protein